MREAGRVTQEGFVIGTPDFLAPEQARNPMAVDIRADIYALGGTLYYLLTGKVPYDGANPTEKLLKHCTDAAAAAAAAAPGRAAAAGADHPLVHGEAARGPAANADATGPGTSALLPRLRSAGCAGGNVSRSSLRRVRSTLSPGAA